MKAKSFLGASSLLLAALSAASAGPLDKAWLRGTTDKNPIALGVGEPVTFTVTPMNLDGAPAEGEYTLWWKRSGDDGKTEEGTVPFTGEPFVYTTSLDCPGFVRLQAFVRVAATGKNYQKQYTGDTTTPEGRKAMNEFEKKNRSVFFDGGAGAEIDSLESHPEPSDFDAFWASQAERLARVPIKADRVETDCPNPRVRRWAVRIDCAGLRPVTGYLSIPKEAENGKKFPCKLETHGYSGDAFLPNKPGGAPDNMIVLNINAHGLKLPEFGATEADRKALRWEARSHDRTYAFDPKQNEDPEIAYFNGMVLRVKRALQYLKTLPEWDGKELQASGGSQGGLQTIWAAGCGEGVTLASSSITWCCDMFMNDARLAKKVAADGWYIQWTDAMGYYDPVNFARRIPDTCKVVIPRAGLGDYCCPPMGLAKLWNNISVPRKQITWVQGSQHGYVPPAYEGRDFVREVSGK